MAVQRSYTTLACEGAPVVNVQRWCERLVLRETRAESVPARTLNALAATPAAALSTRALEPRAYAVRPVPMVTIDRAPAPPTPRRDAPDPATPVSRPPAAMSWPPRPPTAPLPDVEALADRVVQTINRRLNAHAERLGRR